jgi:hypothetical protein
VDIDCLKEQFSRLDLMFPRHQATVQEELAVSNQNNEAMKAARPRQERPPFGTPKCVSAMKALRERFGLSFV